MKKLRIGDIIELHEGNKFCSVQEVGIIKRLCPNVVFPERCKDDDKDYSEFQFNAASRDIFEDLYLVTKTEMTGGGYANSASGRTSVFLDGLKIYCTGIKKHQKIEFYQDCRFTCRIEDVEPISNILDFFELGFKSL